MRRQCGEPPDGSLFYPHVMKRILIVPLALAALSACATQSDVKQIETKVDVLVAKATESKSDMSSSLREVEGKMDALATKAAESKSELASSLKNVLRKQETFERWQKSVEDRFQLFVRNQADIKADLDAIDRKISGLNGASEEIQHALKKLDERQSKLDERVREMHIIFMDAGMAQQQKAEALRGDMTSLLERIGADVAELHAGIDKQKKTPAAERKAPPAKKEAVKKGKPAAEAGPHAGGANRSADDLYGGGYADYLKGEFAAAEAEFTEYVKRFPKTDLSGNAQYWAAEAQANQGKLKEALAGFGDAVKNYPRGAKSATALWRAAEIAEKTGAPDKARELLRKIVDNYPVSYEAAMVEDKLKTLEGSGN